MDRQNNWKRTIILPLPRTSVVHQLASRLLRAGALLESALLERALLEGALFERVLLGWAWLEGVLLARDFS